RDFLKPPRMIAKDAERPPFASEDQFECSVAIKIGEHRAIDEPNCFKALHRDEAAAFVPQQQRSRRFRVTAWNQSAADKQIEIPIPIDIAQCQGPGAGALAEDAFPTRIAPQIVNANRATVGEAI